jgi:hypothetical protein
MWATNTHSCHRYSVLTGGDALVYFRRDFK